MTHRHFPQNETQLGWNINHLNFHKFKQVYHIDDVKDNCYFVEKVDDNFIIHYQTNDGSHFDFSEVGNFKTLKYCK